MSETIESTVTSSTTETPKKKSWRPSKKTIIAIAATATTVAVAAVAVVKSSQSDAETSDLEVPALDESVTETLSDLENPSK